MEAIELARRTALAALKPPPRLKLSEWMESAMRLPEGVSATPGPVRLWPYQRAIADAISDPAIERVTLVKPVRVGFSTLLTGAVEPLRVCRGLQLLSRMEHHEQDNEQVFP